MITRHRSLAPFALGLAVAATLFLLLFYSPARSRLGLSPRTVTLRSPRKAAPAIVHHRGAPSASSTSGGGKTQHNEEYYDDQFYEDGEGGEEGEEEGGEGRDAPRAMAAEPVVVISNPSKGGKQPSTGSIKSGVKRAERKEAVESEAELGEIIEAPPPAADSQRKKKGGKAPAAAAAAAVTVEVVEEEEEEGGVEQQEESEAASSSGNSGSSSSKDTAASSTKDTPKPPPGDTPQSVPVSPPTEQQQQQDPPSPPQKLDARPPRKPPAWLLAGHCTDPLEQDAPLYSQGSMSGSSSSSSSGSGGGSGSGINTAPLPRHAVDWSANSGSHEEHTGDTLLGECTCPLAGPPPSDGWAFDCGDYDWRILSDLAPWHGIAITHEMLDAAFNLNTANVPPGYHFSISGGRVYVKVRPDPMNVYHGKLLDMLRTVASLVPLPDCEFVMHAWDHAKVWRQDPIPVFSYIRDAAKTDVTIPYTYKWSEGSHDFDLGMDGSCPQRWEDRRGGRVAWRGGCTGPATGYHDPFWATYLRYRATTASQSHPEVLDAGLVEECVNAGRAGKVLPSLDLQGGVCHQKFLLLLDGNTASGRSSHWIHSGAVLLKPDSVFSEWWYHLLRPWVHYVPVREYLEDLVEQSTWLVQEAPPSVHTCLANNLKAFARKHVRREAVACYWWRLLTAWAEKQKEKSRTEGFQAL